MNVLPAGREVGEHLVRHPGVDKIAFTGSTAAGMKIASICGEQLKRYTLELGGKSAAIILDDADVDTTLDNLLQVAGLMNNGQACVAQTRVLASRARYDEVVSGLATRMAERSRSATRPRWTPRSALSSPSVSGTGSRSTSSRARRRVRRSSWAAVARPVRTRAGTSSPPSSPRSPTTCASPRRRSSGRSSRPSPSTTSTTPCAIANDSTYGLSGSVWTADAEAGLDIAKRVRTGTFNVNGFMLEPCAPFGGFKQSGVGREGGPEGLAAYLEDKAINRF